MNIASTIRAQIPKEDRVRAKTDPEINRKIDAALERRLRFYSVQDRQTLTQRLEELNREWDVERVLEANASSLVLMSIVLGITGRRKWFVVPVLVSSFLLMHAVQGWCPPVPLLRRLGVRTRFEIEQERYALKMLRGDFDQLEHKEPRINEVSQLVQAVREA
jgi:hypothetical protein